MTTQNIESRDLEAFISLHPSLRTLDISVPDVSLPVILGAAPNVANLAFRPAKCGIGEPKPMHLKNLAEMQVFVSGLDDLSLETLEKVTSCYILPNINKSGDDGKQRFTLRIYVANRIHTEWSKQLTLCKNLLQQQGASLMAENIPEDIFVFYEFNWS
jgi:hypothetical protein